MAIEKFSMAVAKIEMFYKHHELVRAASGTAFFYKSTDEIFLITNWHNVTGLHATTLEVMHGNGCLPNMLRVHYKQWADDAKSAVKSHYADISLFRDRHPAWLEHKERNAVDVVAIPISLTDFPAFANECINTVAPQEPALEARVGMDCFILGFPEKLFGAANTPIWKRGSIAAEPYETHPYYIDSATRKGMSGSPVIAQHTGIFGATGGVLTGTEKIGTIRRFIAVYSSRVGDDELGFQLGTAWQASVIDEILNSKQPGKHPKGWDGENYNSEE